MSERSDTIIIDEIITSINRILEYSNDMDFEDFAEDRKTIDAVARNFEIIGEASRNLSSDFKSNYSDIPWHRIIGLRNVIIHEYFDIDIENVWFIIIKELPDFLTELKQIAGK